MNEAAALLELQGIDVEILRANKRLDTLPEKQAILEVRAKQREIGQMRAKAEMLVRKLEAELKARQDEMTTLAEKIDGEQAKVMATTDHRQVQAITREMDGLRRRNDKLEMESLQYMERIDKANAQLGKIDEALAGLAGKEQTLIGQFKQVGGELQEEIARLESRRTSVAKGVGEKLLATYEYGRESKGGIGVGLLEESACTACRMALPAEKVRDLQAGPDVGLCPQCKRLIVVRMESQA